MNEQTRIRRASTFNEIAELYDHGRRDVPDHVFEDLFSYVAMEPATANVLEIGCGTGQATLPLARLGCRVVGLEMGANLARMASRKLAGFPRVRIVNARFEDWRPEGARFDIAFAANAWHWLDPQLRFARAAAALRPGGVLAYTKAMHAFPPDFDPFFAQIQSCYEEIGEAGMKWPPPSPVEIEDSCDDIECSGYFDCVEVIRRMCIEEFTVDEYIDMTATTSDHQLMEAPKRERLFAEMRHIVSTRTEDRIRKHNLILLHLARRRA